MCGFSLPETLLALLLLAVVTSGLANWQRALAQGLRVQSQTLQLWRMLEQQSDITPVQQAQQQITRSETSHDGCVSITVTLTGLQGHRGQLHRLHCPLK
ncbi:prepilin-type N-terminal cleavage/methylation domain-containing protein [Enterobacteriaceae bacterium 4M9]|nr:prepilin-type N-terminal cleavage/methylation domain-containing protein [Enterobacteriaceae bacterium 4M9]